MRIIIDNQTSRPDATAVSYALDVMKRGKTESSSKGWVYRKTMFESGVVVEGVSNSRSDRLIVREN